MADRTHQSSRAVDAPDAGRGAGPAPDLVTRLRVMIDAAQQMERVMGERLDLRANDLAAMDQLTRGGPRTPTELARSLDITTAAATFLVDRLEGAGHVVRAAHPQDRRKVVVVPTDEAIGRVVTLMQPVSNAMDAYLETLDEHDTEVIARFLDTMVTVFATMQAPPRPGTDQG